VGKVRAKDAAEAIAREEAEAALLHELVYNLQGRTHERKSQATTNTNLQVRVDQSYEGYMH